ncbi:zinc finger C2HC domain-containing protein 1C isoform X1 [Pieris napi]|uniref:zinc finger C2HC domain-containing protein 1C isoform X1 n=1 Tax=Pieris napi TaxID=78633 RepID=UPI001FBA2D35|nr:zinc finger C2HC domain-containing protein 1C isoform X1 [Pieris napi]
MNKHSSSLDHVNWWDPGSWSLGGDKTFSSVNLETSDSLEIRNGWLTLPEPKARFQQKQLQEKEMKIASLYEAQQAKALDRVRHSPSNGTAPTTKPPPTHPPGKVRQMFEERRTKAGIDKSYPLQPIHNTERAQPRKPIPNGYTKIANTTSRLAVEKKTSVRTHGTFSSHSVKKQITQVQNVNNNIIVNGSGDLNHNHEVDLNTVSKLTKCNGEDPISSDEIDGVKTEYNNKHDLLENETFPHALAPVTPRSDDVDTRRIVKKTPAQTSIKASKVVPKTSSIPPKRTTNENVQATESKPRGVMQRANPVPKRTTASPPVPSGVRKPRASVTSASKSGPAGSGAEGDACAVCGRHFAPDRLARHQDICRKTHTKKRKPFDVLKHRLAGTEAEPFIGKLRKGTTSSTKVSKSLNGNWRQKHEEFIQAIRAAKQVQAHLSAGGKLSDLPPPPPSENPDYVQCPHCNRRFNQGAAERHIPKCANFQFNKSKPAARRR